MNINCLKTSGKHGHLTVVMLDWPSKEVEGKTKSWMDFSILLTSLTNFKMYTVNNKWNICKLGLKQCTLSLTDMCSTDD